MIFVSNKNLLNIFQNDCYSQFDCWVLLFPLYSSYFLFKNLTIYILTNINTLIKKIDKDKNEKKEISESVLKQNDIEDRKKEIIIQFLNKIEKRNKIKRKFFKI